MASAAVEELFFRGTVLSGLIGHGATGWAALALSGVLFTAGQVILTEGRLPATVLGLSSVVLSVIGGLLVIVEGSVLPAILVHASFAGYYTQVSTGGARSANPPTHARA
jgi:membrane protease YdiL (CAAX protease family)